MSDIEIINSDLRQELVDQLLSYGELYSCNIDKQQAELMVQHLDLVLLKNQVMNLTRITDPREALVLHILDSILYVKGIDEQDMQSDSHRRFLDIGTGSGYPGIPFGILTGYEGLLIDSVGKKIAAVDEFIKELQLSNMIQSKQVRAEVLAQEEPQSFDYVLARAVSSISTLIEYASPLLHIQGRLILSKSNPDAEEISHSKHACSVCGMSLVSRETFELPHDSGHREILVYEKTKKPKIKLPRNVGMAQHHPL